MLRLKHTRSISASSASPNKRNRTTTLFSPNKVASSEAAAAVDSEPPLPKLINAVGDSIKSPAKGDSVVYWMRMCDLRISDNRALFQASDQASKEQVPLIVLFVFSPQDYIAHDTSPRRIDFVLRNLAVLKTSLAARHIPLYTITHTRRTTLPTKVLSILSTLGATSLFANIEYEVDELRRDIAVCALMKVKGIRVVFVHDRCVVEPGVVLTKEKKSYTVYTPYQRNWLATLNANISYYLENCPLPHANSNLIYSFEKFSPLFTIPVPSSIEGFELDEKDQAKMAEVWPAGEEISAKMLQRFLHTRARPMQLGAVDPLAPGAEDSAKHSRIENYNDGRDRADRDSTSRLSPYLSAGVISARECVRAAMELTKASKVDGGKTTGVGRWIQEVAWRDFYITILAAFPRVSMGRPYLEKFAAVKWENAGDEELAEGEGDEEGGGAFQRWKDGKTGVPIVDAAMRCCKEMGWIHNRLRMIAAMYLTKDLMIDWRLGERYFMQKLIDGDLASNNGGWQWCASTGVDPCPYFRIFNPYKQSLKADPTGDFIRHWVPELAKVRGPDIHNPPLGVANKLRYPKPIVKHDEARQRALKRYKNPGEE